MIGNKYIARHIPLPTILNKTVQKEYINQNVIDPKKMEKSHSTNQNKIVKCQV